MLEIDSSKNQSDLRMEEWAKKQTDTMSDDDMKTFRLSIFGTNVSLLKQHDLLYFFFFFEE